MRCLPLCARVGGELVADDSFWWTRPRSLPHMHWTGDSSDHGDHLIMLHRPSVSVSTSTRRWVVSTMWPTEKIYWVASFSFDISLFFFLLLLHECIKSTSEIQWLLQQPPHSQASWEQRTSQVLTGNIGCNVFRNSLQYVSYKMFGNCLDIVCKQIKFPGVDRPLEGLRFKNLG